MSQPFSMRHKEVLVGGFVLLAAAVFVLLIVLTLVRKEIFEEQYTLKTELSMGIGIDAGMPVTLSGLNIGTVSSVQLDKKGKISLVLRIKKVFQERIRRNSLATVRRLNPAVGDKIINVSQGTPDSPMLLDGEFLNSEDPPELEDALIYLTRMAQDFQRIVGRIEAGEGTLGSLLKERTILDSLDQVFLHGNRLLRNAGNLLHSADGLAGNAGQIIDALPPLLERLGNSLNEINHLALSADSLLANVGKITDNVTPLIESGGNLLGDAEDITTSLKRNWLIRRTLPKLEDKPIYDESR